MGEDALINAIIQGGSTGSGLAVTWLVFRWGANFLTGRKDIRDARLDSRTDNLFEKMEAQIANLTSRLEKAERAVDECKKQHIASEAEVAKLRMEIGVLTNG